MAKPKIDYENYLENENVQWFFHNLMNHESDKNSEGVVNYGGFNQGGGDSSAFGFGQYTGSTRNEILEKYDIDAWSDNLQDQMKAVIATLHMDGDIDNVVSGNFENVFGESDLKTYNYPATKKNKETGEQEPHPNAGQQYKLGGSRWQAFYPEGHRDFKAYENHPKDILLGEKPSNWKDSYNNNLNNAIFDPKSSFDKIGGLDNGADIQMKKRNLYNETYKDSLVPQYILDSIVQLENPGNTDVKKPKAKVNNEDPSLLDLQNIGGYLNKNQNKNKTTKLVQDVTKDIDLIQKGVTVDNSSPMSGLKQQANIDNINNETNKRVNTFDYENLSKDVKDIENKRNRATLRKLSIKAGITEVDDMFKSKKEYEQWHAKNNPSSYRLFGSDWDKAYGEYSPENQNKINQLNKLNTAVETIYDEDYQASDDPEMADKMKIAVLSQLTQEEIDLLNSEAKQTWLTSSLTALDKNNKERIIDNARIHVYNGEQKELAVAYDKLTESSDIMSEKTSTIKSLQSDLTNKQDELEKEREAIFNKGERKFHVIGSTSRDQWFPADVEEYIEFQNRVASFDSEINVFNKTREAYDLELNEYNGKVSNFKAKSEKLQADLAYQIVDGMPVFDASFDDWNASSSEWQESLREVMGRDTWYAKTADVIASFAAPLVGMAADMKTFSYQLGILGAAGVSDILNLDNDSSSSNFDLVLTNMMRGGKVSNLIPVSKTKDTELYTGIKRKGELTGMTTTTSKGGDKIYKYAKSGAEMFAYPITLIYGSRKSVLKKGLANVGKNGKKLKQFGKMGSGRTANAVSKSNTLNKMTWKYLGIAALKPNIKKNSRTIVNSLSPKFKMTNQAIRNMKMINITYKTQMNQNLAFAKSEGLSTGDAFAMASFMSLATGLSQAIMPDYKWIESAAGINIMKKLVTGLGGSASVGSVARNKAKQMAFGQALKSFGKEILEEEIDVAANDLVKMNYLANHSPEILDFATQEQLIIGTTMVAGVFGSVQAVKTKRQVEAYVNNGYRKHADSILETVNMEIEAVEGVLLAARKNNSGSKYYENVITQNENRLKELKTTQTKAAQITNALMASPDYVTDKQVDLMIQLQSAESQKKALSKGNKSLNKAKLDEINTKIKGLSEQIESTNIGDYQATLLQKINAKAKSLTKALGGTFLELDQEGYDDSVELINKQRIEDNDLIDEEIKSLNRKDKNYKKKKQDLLNSKLEIIDKGPNSPGAIYYDDNTKKHVVIVNNDAAMESLNMAVGAHELFHAILRETMIKNPELMKKMAFVLREELMMRMVQGHRGAALAVQKFNQYESGKITNKKADEMFTVMSEMLLESEDLGISNSMVQNFKGIFRQIGRDFFGKDIVISDASSLIDFVKDYSKEAKRGRFSKGMKKVFDKGLDDNFSLNEDQLETYKQSQKAGGIDGEVSSTSESANFYNKKVTEDIGLSKETEKIVAENSRLRQVILDEGIEKDGKIVASPELQMELVSNNMGAAIKLGVFAAANPNVMGLEADKRVTADEFISGYYEQLTNLARTYDASSIEFGAYMNSLLPLRYGQILKEAKKGAVEGRVSIDSEEGKELVGDVNETNNKKEEEVVKKVNVSKRLNVYKEAKDAIKEGMVLLKKGPAKNADGSLDEKAEQKRIARLQELGFADKNGLIVDLDTMTYATVPNVLYTFIAKHFGIDAYKLYPYEKADKNLRRAKDKGSNEMLSAQLAIQKLGIEFFAAIMPEGHTNDFKTTGIAQTKWKVLYNKGARVKNDFPWYKNPVIDTALMLDMVGIVEGKSFREGRSDQQSIISLLNVVGKLMTNQMMREVNLESGDIDIRFQASLEDGLSKFSESKTFRKADNYTKNLVKDGLNNVSDLIYKRGLHLHGTKDFDEEIRKIFKEVYGETLGKNSEGKSIRVELAKDLLGATGLLNQFALMNKNYIESGFVAPPMSEFLEENLIEEYNDKQIYESLGLSKKKGKFTKNDFFTSTMMKRGRKHLQHQVVALEKMIGKEITINGEKVEFTEKMAYEWLFLMMPMYGRATQAGNDSYTFKDGGFRSIKNLNSEKSQVQRSQVTTGVNDFNSLVNNAGTMFKLGDTKQNNKTKKRLGIKKSYSEKSSSVIKEILSKVFDFEGRKNQALQAREVTKWMLSTSMDRVNDIEDSYDKKDLAQLIYSFGSNMESPSRKSAYVYGIADNAISLLNGNLKLAGSLLEYDHAKPHHVAMLKMLDILKGPKETWSENMDVVFSDFVVNIIPKTMDTAIKSMGMQFQVQMGYQQGKPLTDMLGIMGRIYDSKLKGDPRIRIITSLDGNNTVFGKNFTRVTKLKVSPSQSSKSIRFNKAVAKSKQMKDAGVKKGISIWDFDDTLARSNSNVLWVAPDGTKGKLTAEEFAKHGADLLEQGYVYDFSEFSKVVDGKTGPFFEKALARAKKFGVKDQFILTARPENSAVAIYEFLKGVGLKIPFENITGLANSTPESKALWIVDKVAEGYNDIYFADDALQNVQVVEDVLNQFDVKSKVQLAKSSESVDFSGKLNRMIERKKGIKAEKRFSKIKGQKRGKTRGKFRFFIPPSAEDFEGLLYNFIGKGKQGEIDMKVLREALLNPFAKAMNLINKAKQLVRSDYIALLKENKVIRKKLQQKVPSGDFTYEDAVRVYLWTKAGFVVPGLTNTDLRELNDIILNDADLMNFAKQVSLISRVKDGYVKPEEGWDNMNIRYDLDKLSNDIRREDYLTDFVANREAIFGKWQNGKLVGENMNKIEAAYGSNMVDALSDVMWRMENGSNRNFGKNKLVNQFMNYINGSVATTMFFNARSAILQTLSTANFINWEDNNILAASKAFANQPQFWSDFAMLFNSDMLKQRRSGLTQDLNASELVAIVGKSKNKALAAANYLLQIGFAPTQIADSFAIAMGGSTFYRNRVGKYIKEGMSKQEAEKKAFIDFGEIAEKTQQSARPDMISQQQASPLGRLILAFANTPMQYTRLQKKAFQDLVNGRGDAKSHISRIIYYGFAQNLIFTALQNALFALPFLSDEEDEELIDKKGARMLNSMLDSTLRGIGVYGAVVATVKNMFREFVRQDEKGRRADYAYVLIEFFNLSPPIGIKSRKIYNGLTTYKYNRKDIRDGDLNLMAEMGSSIIEGTLNVPTSRLYTKLNNINEATKSEYETWQRIAMFLGWSKWNLGVGGKKKKKKSKRKGRTL